MFNPQQANYESFRNILKERTTPVVAWVGAGLSRPAGLPSWAELRRRLCDALRERVDLTHDETEKRRLTAAVNNAQTNANPWVGFQILKKELGWTAYKGVVRDTFGTLGRVKVPAEYRDLWMLRVRGILNLNLDRLATRAFSETPVGMGKNLNEFLGTDSAPNVHVLKSPDPFVANLHGVHHEEPSWVLTNDELQRLLSNDGYRLLVQSVLATNVVVFVGITADDVAAGGHLSMLTRGGLDLGSHYWITSRTDAATRQWADESGIRQIYYSVHGDDHSELSELFADLKAYVPPEVPAPPVAPVAVATVSGDDVGEPDQLVNLPPEVIRRKLNARAVEILGPRTPEAYESYDQFCRRFQRAIHAAWFVTTDEPDNVIMGYRLVKHLADGAFGEVYLAESPGGESVAVKILHENVRRNPGMLQAFRRGVRSMRILSKGRVAGMVPYRDAAEIPAFAVMDMVPGVNLKEAVQSRGITEWDQRLRVACSLARIIRSAHSLPERVLHRDVRPSNIMLKNFWEDPGGWEVVVLDFDLSWHKDSFEKSVVSSTATSYLAPEQISGRDSTRNAAVDSFGVGMTLLYVLRGRDPVALEHLHRDWSEALQRLARDNECAEWRSLPARYCRLVDNATKDRQIDRWDMAQIENELERLKRALEGPENVEWPDLFAEELLARAGFRPDEYEWRADSVSAVGSLPSGVHIEVRGDNARQAVSLSVGWQNSGDLDRKSVHKYLPGACERAASALKRSHWVDVESSAENQGAMLSARIGIFAARDKIDAAAAGVRNAADALRLT